MSKRKLVLFLKLACIGFFIPPFFVRCASVHNARDQENLAHSLSIEISDEERIWMKNFFQGLLLDDPNNAMIYTLFGTKPMSSVVLIYATKEEMKKENLLFIQEHLNDLNSKQKKRCLSRLEKFWNNYDLADNWDKWMEWKKRGGVSRFLFRKDSTKNTHIFNAYMLNVQEAYWTLQKHKLTFQNELNISFEPLEVVLEFEDLNSIFWRKVLSNNLLLGLLYGYGERNSFFFATTRFSEIKEFKSIFPAKYSFDYLKKKPHRKRGLRKLAIPSFVSYPLNYGEDPVVQVYKKERDIIRKNLSNKNLVDETLKKMLEN